MRLGFSGLGGDATDATDATPPDLPPEPPGSDEELRRYYARSAARSRWTAAGYVVLALLAVNLA